MGRVKITYGARFGQRELATTTLIGRHWSCDIILHHEDVPLRWVEVRWIRGKWGWRALSREGDTIGPSAWLQPGWRALNTAARENALRLREIATIELTDASGPQPYAVDLQSGRILVRQPLQQMLSGAGIQSWRSASGSAVSDGSVLVVEGKPWRLHLPARAAVTDEDLPSLVHTDTLLKLDAGNLEGAIELGGLRIDLSREMTRILIPYAEALTNEYQFEDAWLTRDEAHARWLELGGNPESPPQRLGWMRGKVKSYLARHGLADVDGLFESQRVGQWYGTRLGLSPDQVVLT